MHAYKSIQNPCMFLIINLNTKCLENGIQLQNSEIQFVGPTFGLHLQSSLSHCKVSLGHNEQYPSSSNADLHWLDPSLWSPTLSPTSCSLCPLFFEMIINDGLLTCTLGATLSYQAIIYLQH